MLSESPVSRCAAGAPDGSLVVVDPAISLQVRQVGPQPRAIDAAVDQEHSTVVQDKGSRRLSLQAGRLRGRPGIAAVRADRVVVRQIGRRDLVVDPRHRQKPPVGHLADLGFPVDDPLLRIPHHVPVFGPAPPAVVRDERHHLHAVGTVAVPTPPGGGGQEPAAIAQGHDRAAQLKGRTHQRRGQWLGEASTCGPRPPTRAAASRWARSRGSPGWPGPHRDGRSRSERTMNATAPPSGSAVRRAASEVSRSVVPG